MVKLRLSGWKKRPAPGSAGESIQGSSGDDEMDDGAAQESANEAGPEAAATPPLPAWEALANEPLPDNVPARGDSVVIDEPNTEPGLLYIQDRVLTSAITPVHIATHDRPSDRRIEAMEQAAQAARLLVCDIQECSDGAEPLLAHALASIIRDASRVAVELQSVLAALKKAP